MKGAAYFKNLYKLPLQFNSLFTLIQRLKVELSQVKKNVSRPRPLHFLKSPHIFLASLHAPEDYVLPFEEPEIDAEDDLDEREYESNRPKRSERMTATACDFVYY